MRSMWWIAATVLVIGCSKDPEGQGDDTGDPIDTDTEDTDTEDTDTGEPPQPATYEPDEAIVFDMNPIPWVPLEYTEPVYNTTIGGFDISITVGANVSGKTDVSLTVDSHLDRESDGDYVWYFTGLKDGGKLNSEVHVNFPMVFNFEGIQFDVSELVLDNTIPQANELDWVFPQHIFDTLNLSGDGEITTHVGTVDTWEWTSGKIDPASWLPYITFDVTAAIELTSTFRTTKYEIRDITSDANIATQTKAVDRGNVDTYVGELGAEAAQIRFDGKAEGELKNSLQVDLNLKITLEAQGAQTSFDFPFDIDLADEAHWKIQFDEERITHPKDTTP